jgi:hypothetical protein
MTFARIFIANHIDKIHTLSNETALLKKGTQKAVWIFLPLYCRGLCVSPKEKEKWLQAPDRSARGAYSLIYGDYLFTFYFLLFTFYFLLFTFYFLLFTSYFLLLTFDF